MDERARPGLERCHPFNRSLTASLVLFKNAELFSFTYGALVVQLIKDYEDYAEVNKQLEKMSVNCPYPLLCPTV